MVDFDGSHQSIPFTGLHKAKFDSGLASAKPLAAEGVGDVYFSTDTEVLSICKSGTTWTDYTLGSGGGGLAYLGQRRHLSSDTTLPGDDSSAYFGWDGEDWHVGDFGSGATEFFNQPELGIYEVSVNLAFENSNPGRFHVEAWYDGTTPGTLLRSWNVQLSGDGNDVYFNFTEQFLATVLGGDGGSFYLYIYQNTTVDAAIRSGSSAMIKKIGDTP